MPQSNKTKRVTTREQRLDEGVGIVTEFTEACVKGLQSRTSMLVSTIVRDAQVLQATFSERGLEFDATRLTNDLRDLAETREVLRIHMDHLVRLRAALDFANKAK